MVASAVLDSARLLALIKSKLYKYSIPCRVLMKKISFRDQNRVLHQAVNTIISTVKFGISIMWIDSLLEPQVTI